MEPRPTVGNGSDAPLPDSYSPDDFLTPSQARAAREKREATTVFDLVHTGGKALVRRVTLTDTAIISGLPDRLQYRVLQMINDLRTIDTDAGATNPDGSLDIANVMALLKADANGHNLLCVLGFVRPRLITSDAERSSPDEVLVTDLDPRDRKAFWDWNQGTVAQEAERIAPFPDEPTADVAAGGPGGVDGDPAGDPPWPSISGIQ